MEKLSKLFGFVCFSIAALSLAACERKSADSVPTAKSSEERVVNLATWSNYVNPAVIEEFTKKTGIKVVVSNFSSNEELLAKLQAGATGLDVAVPSDYMVTTMAELKLAEPLRKEFLPNLAEVDPQLLNKEFDPSNTYSVPFTWGTTGIAIQRSLFKGEVTGWKNVLGNKELKGRVSLLDDAREVIAIGLKTEGLSLNDASPEALAKAKQRIVAAKPGVKRFTSEPLMDLVNGEISVAQIYSSDALLARQQTNGAVDYVIPEEGCTLFMDNYVIPKGAKNIEAAHEFINYMITAETNAKTVEKILVPPVNVKAGDFLSEEIKKNAILFPDKSKLAKCEMMKDLGEEIAKLDKVWTEIKLAKN